MKKSLILAAAAIAATVALASPATAAGRHGATNFTYSTAGGTYQVRYRTRHYGNRGNRYAPRFRHNRYRQSGFSRGHRNGRGYGRGYGQRYYGRPARGGARSQSYRGRNGNRAYGQSHRASRGRSGDAVNRGARSGRRGR